MALKPPSKTKANPRPNRRRVANTKKKPAPRTSPRSTSRTSPRSTSRSSAVVWVALVAGIAVFGLWYHQSSKKSKSPEDAESAALQASPAEAKQAAKKAPPTTKASPEKAASPAGDEAKAARKEAERKEAERKEAERKEAERKEAEQKEAERKEAEQKEAERKEAEQKEAERQEAERLAAEFPMHAVAFHFHAQVLEKPQKGSRVIAYARRGGGFRVSSRVSTEDCRRGWHKTINGGYICDGEGYNVAAQPISYAPAPQGPNLDNPMPYDYRYVQRHNTIEYWKVPSLDEMKAVDEVLGRIRRRDKGGGASAEPQHDEDALREVLARARAIAADGGIAVSGEADAPALGVLEPAPSSEVAPPPPADPYDLPSYVHLRLARGFYVTANQQVDTWIQTVRGRYIAADSLSEVTPSSLKGELISSRNPLPIVFVTGIGANYFERATPKAALRPAGDVPQYARFALLEEVTEGKRRFYRVGENRYVSARVANVARLVPPPAGVKEGEKWIDVHLTEQTLVAYEGATPVFATVVSSGRAQHRTPPGSFRVYGKHISIIMDDPDAGTESYSIEDVPWTQFYDKGYALHAAFWHDRFGRVRSHGCINLSPGDARRLFFWTGPEVPVGMHGAIAIKGNPGTLISIRE